MIEVIMLALFVAYYVVIVLICREDQNSGENRSFPDVDVPLTSMLRDSRIKRIEERVANLEAERR